MATLQVWVQEIACMPCAQVLSEPGYFMRDPGMIRVAICEAGRARPAQPIDHSIGKTGMPKMTASGREHRYA
jgi:hypothetical protein